VADTRAGPRRPGEDELLVLDELGDKLDAVWSLAQLIIPLALLAIAA
jgi:hypothetical protein